MYMGRWSRKVAPLFLEWLGAPTAKSWIDVGCGSGGLAHQVATICSPSSLLGIDPSEGFVESAKKQVPSGDFRVGSGIDLEFADGSLDYAVSGLVLNFVPDSAKMIDEMVRIVKPGGTVASYVWDYAGQMQIMRYFFDAAFVIDADASAFDDGLNAPICRPQPLADAFSSAGLVDVATTAIDIATPFTDFDDYWSPFLGGTGSAPRYCMSLDDDVRNKIKRSLQSRLPTGPDGEILLAARAWGVKGKVRS
ncbi:MAG: methyltransferase domain-containing protein [Chloroflexi bacterium]|nr:methyltransferase domain-containing protein [Chloroflexota bacterium]